MRATKEALGWDPDAEFEVAESVYERFAGAGRRGATLRREWMQRIRAWHERDPDAAAEWEQAHSGRPRPGVGAALPEFSSPEKLATRAASSKVMQAFAPFAPTMLGGSADLAGSVNTRFAAEPDYTRARSGRNVHWGVREHAMAAAV